MGRETIEEIIAAKDYLLTYRHTEVLQGASKRWPFITIDFTELQQIDTELAEKIIDDPRDAQSVFSIACEEITPSKKKMRIRFRNLPSSSKIPIREIRVDNKNTLVVLEGYIRQKTDVIAMTTQAKYECPSCGNIIPVIRTDDGLNEPKACPCGFKGKLRKLEDKEIDTQDIVLEEPTENLEGGEQPRRIRVLLKEDLVSLLTDKTSNPGARILLTGVVKTSDKEKTTDGRKKIFVEGNDITPLTETYQDIKITPQEEEYFEQIAKREDLSELLTHSFAPTIHGLDMVKRAILFQIVGGNTIIDETGVQRRGNTHLLLCGEPSSGKTYLLRCAAKIAPKCVYANGRSTSAAGLCGSVSKDEVTGEWCVQPGVLVMAHKGLGIIDELNLMTKEDASSMLQAMESLEISINKASVRATLVCETSVLAAANPKLGRFDQNISLVSQIDLSPPLLSRFDLIFPILDTPDEKKDALTANAIFKAIRKDKEHSQKELLPAPVMRKFLAYVKRKYTPEYSQEAQELAQSYYQKLRDLSRIESQTGERSLAITTRQLEGIIRLSQASAKLRCSATVDSSDAKRAIELVDYCIRKLGVDPETGRIDIDRIGGESTSTERGKRTIVKDIIEGAYMQYRVPVSFTEINLRAKEKGLSENAVDETLRKLIRDGDIFEPKTGCYMLFGNSTKPKDV